MAKRSNASTTTIDGRERDGKVEIRAGRCDEGGEEVACSESFISSPVKEKFSLSASPGEFNCCANCRMISRKASRSLSCEYPDNRSITG